MPRCISGAPLAGRVQILDPRGFAGQPTTGCLLGETAGGDGHSSGLESIGKDNDK